MSENQTDVPPEEMSEVNEEMTAFLQETIQDFDCVSGTLHRKEEGGLKLVAHEGIPESVLARTKEIPVGKGMAGIAAERMEPVEVCNLQTDDSGVAESRARDTGMEGSIAAPITGSDGELAGTIGIAKPDSYEFTTAEREQLLQAGEQIADRL